MAELNDSYTEWTDYNESLYNINETYYPGEYDYQESQVVKNRTHLVISVTAFTLPFDVLYLSLVILFGFSGNLLIFGAVYAEKTLRTSANVFVCNLAVCDLLITCYICPFVLANVLSGYDVLVNIPVMCTTNSLIVMSTCGLSIYTMALIAVNRYVSVCQPTKMNEIFTNRNILSMMIGIWLVVPMLPTTPTLFTEGLQVFNPKTAYCLYDQRNILYSTYLIFLGIIGPAVVAAVCYVLIYKRIKAMKSVNQRESKAAKKRKQREQRLILMLFLSMMFFLTFWSPFALSALMDMDDQQNSFFVKYSAWIALSNSCINSWLYGIMNSNFRRGYKRVLCFWRKDIDSDEKNSRANGSRSGGGKKMTKNKVENLSKTNNETAITS